MEFRFSMCALIALLFSIFAVAGTPSKDSLYILNSTWTNQAGEKIKLKDLAGHPVILSMVYTHCKYSCPLTVEKLKKIDKQLKEREDVRFVLASFDTHRETPEWLDSFMKERKISAPRWSIIFAKKKTEVRELATLLGISFKEDPNNEFSHSNEINLLNKDGVIQLKITGMASETETLLKKLEEK